MESEEMMNSPGIAIEMGDFEEAIGKMRKQKADPPNRQFKQQFKEPRIISIGAFNWQRCPKLKEMDYHKSHYVDAILRRNTRLEIRDYYMKLKELEDEVRSSYKEVSKDASKKLLEIMMVDGCFIVEYFLQVEEGVDRLNVTEDARQQMEHDMLLLQNHLPLSVLECIYCLATGKTSSSMYDIITQHYIYSSFLPIRPSFGVELPKRKKNLLQLFHGILMPADKILMPIDIDKDKRLPRLPSAVELRAAGIKFKVKRSPNFEVVFHRGFQSGTIEIPPLIVDKYTAPFIQNLVQYEEGGSDIPLAVTSYVKFLDDIIFRADDVTVLRKSGIIRHAFKSDDNVLELVYTTGGRKFNCLTPSTAALYENILNYYEAKRHRWWAILLRNHFSSPWSFIKLLAPVSILILTFTQTFFSVYALYRSRGS